jgi:hypothetical protein
MYMPEKLTNIQRDDANSNFLADFDFIHPSESFPFYFINFIKNDIQSLPIQAYLAFNSSIRTNPHQQKSRTLPSRSVRQKKSQD